MSPSIGKHLTFILSKINHNTVEYVGNPTNVIEADNPHDIQQYINIYFKVLEEFHNLNKLMINRDKSKLLVITKPNMRYLTNNIKLQADGYIIEQSQKMKVLGIFI